MTQTVSAYPLLQRPGVRQFAKFCIIGASSFLVDFCISYALIFGAKLNPTLAKSLSFLVSVTNGFIWNSRWTFRGMGSGRRHEMFVKFLAVNIVGLILNIAFFKSVLWTFTGHFFHQVKVTRPQFVVAAITAAVCVASWNFLASKKWTFNNRPDADNSR